MAKQWEITGRLGELQLEWLRAHYTQQQLDEALVSLPKRGYPLNVARWLEAAGGPRMPPPAELLAADPESQQRAIAARIEALDHIKQMLGLDAGKDGGAQPRGPRGAR
jgi:hypothetical protein